MKWFFLFVEIAAVLPLANWLRHNRRYFNTACGILAFLALKPGLLHVDMALISWSGFWRGYVQGFEFFLIDFFAVAIFLSLPNQQRRLRVPFLFGALCYFAAVSLSVFQAGPYLASLFYVWQLARIILLAVIVSKACADEHVAKAMITGIAVAICFQTLDAVWERFGHGVLRAAGSVGSENLLGVLSHFIVFPAFALALAQRRDKFFLLATAAGILVAVLTTSRATVVATALGLALVFMLSAMRGWTIRKSTVTGLAALGLLLLVPLVVSSFSTRFTEQNITDVFGDDSRTYMENAARSIISDHPMGIGANQYIVVANTQGYNVKAHVTWVNMNTDVHNSYLLITAETGYLGLVTFLIMILPPLIAALRYGLRAKNNDMRGDMLIGIGVSLLIVYLHAFYEWLFLTSQVQYLFAISVGMVGGLIRQLRVAPGMAAARSQRPISSRAPLLSMPKRSP